MCPKSWFLHTIPSKSSGSIIVLAQAHDPATSLNQPTLTTFSPPPSQITMGSDDQPNASESPCSAELHPARLSVEQHTAEPHSAVQPPPTVERALYCHHWAYHGWASHCCRKCHSWASFRWTTPCRWTTRRNNTQLQDYAGQARAMQAGITETPAHTKWKQTLLVLMIILNGLCM